MLDTSKTRGGPPPPATSAGSGTPSRPKLAPLDILARDIQWVLRHDPPEPGTPAGGGQFAEHGYAASEAYFHLAALEDIAVRPIRLEVDGAAHWCLLDESDRVIDLSLGRKDRGRAGDVPTLPYETGKRRAFRRTQLGPSKRARHIMVRARPDSLPEVNDERDRYAEIPF